jgi:GT2 family glycosyltransferase
VTGLVSVGFLHPGHYAACFAKSLQQLLFFDATGPQRIVSHQYGEIGKECGSGGIVDGRNQLAKMMCDQSDADWLFMVDSDMGFAPDTVERLIEAADPNERPVVGGLAFAQKTDGRSNFYGIRYRAQPTLYDYVDLEDRVGFVPRFDYPRNELVTVAATGGAVVLIHRSVLERIRAKHGEVWFNPIIHPKGPTTFSEDLSFCVRVASLDLPMYVHTGVKTTHDKGGVFYDEEFYDRQQAALEV